MGKKFWSDQINIKRLYLSNLNEENTQSIHKSSDPNLKTTTKSNKSKHQSPLHEKHLKCLTLMPYDGRYSEINTFFDLPTGDSKITSLDFQFRNYLLNSLGINWFHPLSKLFKMNVSRICDISGFEEYTTLNYCSLSEVVTIWDF